jgi:rhodanese-related sulfurtransferase
MNFQNFKSAFAPAGAGQVQTISGPSAVELHADPDTVFVDVRSHGEIQMSGTVQGAIIAPLPEFGRHAHSDGSGSLPSVTAGKRIICVCASGARSGAAAQQLLSMGYDNVGNLRGGIGAWLQAGGPTQR